MLTLQSGRYLLGRPEALEARLERRKQPRVAGELALLGAREALALADSPAAIPRLIRSRSSKRRRRREWSTRRRKRCAWSRIRHTVTAEQPNSATISFTFAPFRSRFSIALRSGGRSQR
jgi:hypothetical protein